jgi:hypothetical protein
MCPHNSFAVLIASFIEVSPPPYFVKDYLYNAITLVNLKVCSSHVRQAQGQLPAKTGVHKTRTEEDTPPSQR